MQACNYSFLKDAIVHLNIKYGLWFQSKIPWDFTKPLQTNSSTEVTHFRQDFFFFFFCKVMQRLVFCDSLFRGRTFLKWSTYLFIPYSQTPQRALYKSFSGGWEVIFFSALLMFSHSFPGVFAAFSKFQTNKQFPNKLIMCCIRSLCKPMEGNQIMCAPWILECIHLVLRAGLTGAYRKHCMYV